MRPWKQNAIIAAMTVGIIALIVAWMLSIRSHAPPPATHYSDQLADYGAGVVVLDPGVEP